MVSEKKKELVQSLVNKIHNCALVGVVNLQSLPAQQLQKMRTMLRTKGVDIFMARKRLLYLALTTSKKENVEQLKEKIKGMPALLFTNQNPFTLYSIIQKNKSEALAKAGQTAPKDVIVKAGPTNFAPGPIISELAAVGIKTKVDAGKLAILSDVTVAKEGDVISGKLAETLKRLDIKPMEIGLDLVAVWENGLVFDAKQLRIDEAEYVQNIVNAVQWAMNLAVECAYCTTETTELLLQKAFQDAKALAVEREIMTDLTAEEILAKVERQALALKEIAGVETIEKPAFIKNEKEDDVVEEKKEETATFEEKKEAEVRSLDAVEKPVAKEEKLTFSLPGEDDDEDEGSGEEEKLPEPEKEELPTQELKSYAVPSAESLVLAMKEKYVESDKEVSRTKSGLKITVEKQKVKESVIIPESSSKGKGKYQEVEEMARKAQEILGGQLPEQDAREEIRRVHPKQGGVSEDQAQDLLKQLQKKGTLR